MCFKSYRGEKPYQCTVEGCGKRFTQSGTLAKHAVRHRELSGNIQPNTVKPRADAPQPIVPSMRQTQQMPRGTIMPLQSQNSDASESSRSTRATSDQIVITSPPWYAKQHCFLLYFTRYLSNQVGESIVFESRSNHICGVTVSSTKSSRTS